VASGSFALKCFATARSESRLVARGTTQSARQLRGFVARPGQHAPCCAAAVPDTCQYRWDWMGEVYRARHLKRRTIIGVRARVAWGRRASISLRFQHRCGCVLLFMCTYGHVSSSCPHLLPASSASSSSSSASCLPSGRVSSDLGYLLSETLLYAACMQAV